MRCNNCTTELWGRPSACPVCGTPTGLKKTPRAQVTGTLRPNRPQSPPAPEPPSFFNASDLVDPEILDEIGVSPAQPRQHSADLRKPDQRSKPPAELSAAGGGGFLSAADLFDPDIFDHPEPSEAPGQPAGQISAADLFDPELLDLPMQEETPGGPPRFNASELLDEDLLGGQFAPGWGEADMPEEPGWNTGPRVRPRASSPPPMPPVAAPLFNLQPLAPEAPPRRPSRPRATRSAGQPPAYVPDPTETAYVPDPTETGMDPVMDRGWRIVPSSAPPEIMQPGARPGRQRRPPPPRPGVTHRLTSVLGKTAALVLVLVIIGVAIQVGYTRCQQLNCWQTIISAQSTALPTLTPIPGFASYQDAQLGVALEYPKNWQHAASHRANDAGYQSDRFSISSYAWIEIGTSPQYGGWSSDQINAATINFLKSSPTILSVQTWVPDTPTTHLDGQDWAIEDAAFTLQDGTNLQLTTLALIYNGRGYVIFYQSHQEEFTHFSSQYFEPMLLSFRFLNH